MTREEKRKEHQARIDARRQAYHNKREHLLEKRETRRSEKSRGWGWGLGDAFEAVGIFILGILEALG